MPKQNQSEKRTRQRGKNFSPSEEDILLRLLKPYKPIIDNKKSDAMTCQMKKEAWEQLAQKFTRQTGMPRTWRTLKDKYKNMNTKTKTEGRRLVNQPINQLDDFELTPSSFVSVVYDEVGEEEYDLIEIKPEKFEESPIQQEVEEEVQEEVQEEVKEEVKEEVQGEFLFLSPLSSDKDPITPPTNNSKRSLEADRHELIRLQQRFYNNENARSAKRHRLELKNLNLKSQILELELEERRMRLENNKENTTITPS